MVAQHVALYERIIDRGSAALVDEEIVVGAA
jgi:hypothetical protein